MGRAPEMEASPSPGKAWIERWEWAAGSSRVTVAAGRCTPPRSTMVHCTMVAGAASLLVLLLAAAAVAVRWSTSAASAPSMLPKASAGSAEAAACTHASAAPAAAQSACAPPRSGNAPSAGSTNSTWPSVGSGKWRANSPRGLPAAPPRGTKGLSHLVAS